MQNRDVLVYVTSPVTATSGRLSCGSCTERIAKRMCGSSVSDAAGINKQEFDAYYSGSHTAYALKNHSRVAV